MVSVSSCKSRGRGIKWCPLLKKKKKMKWFWWCILHSAKKMGLSRARCSRFNFSSRAARYLSMIFTSPANDVQQKVKIYIKYLFYLDAMGCVWIGLGWFVRFSSWLVKCDKIEYWYLVFNLIAGKWLFLHPTMTSILMRGTKIMVRSPNCRSPLCTNFTHTHKAHTNLLWSTLVLASRRTAIRWTRQRFKL